MDSTIVSIASTPIPGDAPAGIEARYENEYTTLLEEIDKLTAMSTSTVCNWQVVCNMGLSLLQNKTKDFLIGCYTASALARVNGLSGMADGTRLLTALCTAYWDTGFPPLKRLRRRANALTWWRDGTEVLLQKAIDETPQDRPQPAAVLEDLTSALNGLDTVLGEVMPDLPPLRALTEMVRRIPASLPQPAQTPPQADAEAAPAEQPAAPAPAAAAATPQPTTPQAMAPVESLTPPPAAPAPSQPVIATPVLGENMQANINAFSHYALQLADVALKANQADSFPWQLSRFALWGKLTRLPPAQGRQTAIPAPSQDLKEAVMAQLRAGRYVQAALAAQDLFLAKIWWLDAQYLAAQALEHCGQDFAGALRAVTGETAIFLSRLPGVEELTFDDGTPFADDTTRHWLQTLLSRSTADNDRSSTGSAIDEARGLFADGRKIRALDRLDQELIGTRETADRLQLRMEQCRLLMRATQWSAATALADELMETYRSMQLPLWSASLAMDVLNVARQAWEGLGGEQSVVRMCAITAQMTLLRPSTALEQP